jgi:aromatic amino acid aminotransferase I
MSSILSRKPSKFQLRLHCKVSYIISVGQNPTGSTLSVDRRKHIYAIAQRWDLIIMEDGKQPGQSQRYHY